MEEIGPIALFVLWVLASLFGRAAQGRKQRQRQPTQSLPQRSDQSASRPGKPTTFDELLAEMRGQVEQAQKSERVEVPERITWQQGLPDDEAVEDTTSLEEEPEVVSLEVEPYRPERVNIDQVAATEALVQQRIAAAELRNREWRLEDHRRFDQAIREAKQAPVRRVSPVARSLRQAMIWNEVLQPPVSLRDTPPGKR